MILNCPACGARHVEDKKSERAGHAVHDCHFCGVKFQPALVHTMGVKFLTGADGEAVVTLQAAVTVEKVKSAVASYYRLPAGALESPDRFKGLTLSRHIAMYLARKHTASSFPEIGGAFGRNHSTIISAYDRVSRLLAKDAAVRHVVKAIEGVLVGDQGGKK